MTTKAETIAADELAAKKIHKICDELELAIQEATNRGLSVDPVVDRSYIYASLSRPLRYRVQRYMNYDREAQP